MGKTVESYRKAIEIATAEPKITIPITTSGSD
jgi:hypothetical protein